MDMKITDVKTLLLYDPEGQVIQDATIFPIDEGAKGRMQLFVQIQTDAGFEGLGVAAGIRANRAVIHDTLEPVILGRDPFATEQLWNEMYWRVRGFGRKGVAFQAISAVDIALWDLKAKAFGVPLYRLLGTAHDAVPVYGSGGWTNYSTEELVAEQQGYVNNGHKRVKMKVGKDFGRSEREDIERVAAVRKALGDDIDIYIDANNGYYAKQAIRLSRVFEEYDIGWFEEPVLADDIEGLAAVSNATNIPVATGEHEYTKHGIADLIMRKGADIVQPDIGRVGGVTEWMKAAVLADGFNLPVAPHAYALFHLHCAMATPNLKVVEMLGAEENSNKHWFKEVPEQVNGMLKPFSDRPGFGLELDPDTVRNYSID